MYGSENKYYIDKITSEELSKNIEYDTGDRIWRIRYINIKGELHRVDGPAMISYQKNENDIEEEVWCQNGIRVVDN